MNNKKLITKLIISLVMILIVMTVSRKNILADEKKEYVIKVNSSQNCLTIYEKGTDGQTLVPLKAMACSAFEYTNTESAVFTIKNKMDWKKIDNNTYEQYASGIGNNVAIASVPYQNKSADSMSTENYNKIGEEKSPGDIWVSVTDAKWIYDNCQTGTSVEIYADAENAGPLGIPETMKLPSTSKFTNWDPTDPNEDNPWKKCSARIEGAKSIEVSTGESCDLLKNVQAYDTCGNNITKNVIVLGNYDLKKPGSYVLTYYIKDVIGSEATADVKLYVKDPSEQNQETITEAVNSQGDIKKNEKNEKNGNNSEKVRIIVGITIISTMFAVFLIKCLKKD